ncbi:MAG TPA: hypothetical protein VKM72_14645 [Thermoanaerobaculia bacterium]|nr:hypothetical protein [Thermoanaerobaculia bacterium]
METTIQETQQGAPERAVFVPTEECQVCASGFDPNVGASALFQEALHESV